MTIDKTEKALFLYVHWEKSLFFWKSAVWGTWKIHVLWKFHVPVLVPFSKNWNLFSRSRSRSRPNTKFEFTFMRCFLSKTLNQRMHECFTMLKFPYRGWLVKKFSRNDSLNARFPSFFIFYICRRWCYAAWIWFCFFPPFCSCPCKCLFSHLERNFHRKICVKKKHHHQIFLKNFNLNTRLFAKHFKANVNEHKKASSEGKNIF